MTKLWLMSLKGTDMMGSGNRGTSRASENGRISQRRKKIPRSLSLLTLKTFACHQLRQKMKRSFGKCSGLDLQMLGGRNLVNHDLGSLASPQSVWIFSPIRNIALNVSQSPFLLYAVEAHGETDFQNNDKWIELAFFYLLPPPPSMICFFQVFYFIPKMWATDLKDWGSQKDDDEESGWEPRLVLYLCGPWHLSHFPGVWGTGHPLSLSD